MDYEFSRYFPKSYGMHVDPFPICFGQLFPGRNDGAVVTGNEFFSAVKIGPTRYSVGMVGQVL